MANPFIHGPKLRTSLSLDLDDDEEEELLHPDDDTNLLPTRRPKLGTVLRILLLVLLATGVTTFLGLFIGSHQVQDKTVQLIDVLSSLPKAVSSVIMILLYAFALVLFCPGTPFNLAAGFMFGIWIGILVALGGCLLGATIAFVCGRTIAREWIKSKMEKYPKFNAVDWAIQKNGLYIVFLTRLSPLFPFPLLNYAFGITKLSLWQYVAGTLAGVMPATIGYTYLGTLMRNLTDMWNAAANEEDGQSSGKTSPQKIILLAVGATLTILSIIVITLITKRAISKATKEYNMLHGLVDEEADYKGAQLEMEPLSQQDEILDGQTTPVEQLY